jgi:hypothetical protein
MWIPVNNNCIILLKQKHKQQDSVKSKGPQNLFQEEPPTGNRRYGTAASSRQVSTRVQ